MSVGRNISNIQCPTIYKLNVVNSNSLMMNKLWNLRTISPEINIIIIHIIFNIIYNDNMGYDVT